MTEYLFTKPAAAGGCRVSPTVRNLLCAAVGKVKSTEGEGAHQSAQAGAFCVVGAPTAGICFDFEFAFRVIVSSPLIEQLSSVYQSDIEPATAQLASPLIDDQRPETVRT